MARGRWRLGRGWLQAAVFAGALFVPTEALLVKGFSVHGPCMEPNLRTGERVLGSGLIYRLRPPRRGEIVAFRSPRDLRRIYVKRVVGLPGETVAIRNGAVLVSGRRLPEGYVAHAAHGDFPRTRVPAGHYFVLGDNRDHSSDSRMWGPLPAANLEGRVWLRYWPLCRMGMLRAGA